MEELDVSMFQNLPLPMRQSLTRQGIPNLLSQEEATTVRTNVGDEVGQVTTNALEGGVQVGDQVGPEAMPLPVDPYPVSTNVPDPSPEGEEMPDIKSPDLVDPEGSDTTASGKLDKLESDIDKILKIPGLTFERQKELLEMKGKIALQRDAIEARTRENIARYNANALREAEVAKALTLVAYKASRPDSELVSQLMSPMSGLSSLYKAVGPVQLGNIQTGGLK